MKVTGLARLCDMHSREPKVGQRASSIVEALGWREAQPAGCEGVPVVVVGGLQDLSDTVLGAYSWCGKQNIFV